MDSAENTHLTTGIHAQQHGQWKQALRSYSAAIALAPNDAFAYQLRGGLNLELKRYLDALHDFNQSILLAPYNEIGFWGKAKVFVGLGDLRWAVIQYTNAIDLIPEQSADAVAYYLDRAEAYALLGEHARAQADRQHAQGLADSL